MAGVDDRDFRQKEIGCPGYMRRTFFALAAAMLLPAARAQAASSASVVVTPQDPAASDFARRAGVDPASMKAQIEGELDRLFQVGRLEDYLRMVGDSNAFTTKGMGVDYATNLKFAMIGAAANVAVNARSALTSEDARTKPPIAALTTNFTLMGGVNLGAIGLHEVTLFGNYFKQDAKLGDDFSGSLYNWGAHGQIKLLGPNQERALSALIQWGGIAITSGVEHSRTELRLGKKFKRDLPFGSAGGFAIAVGADSSSRFNVNMETYSVPLEVTTSLRLLTLLTAYGGAGFDWQMGGGADMSIDVGTRLSGKVMGEDTGDLGEAHVTASADAPPSRGRLRAILGLQLNIAVVRLFTQLNIARDPFLASVAFGARVAY